jgi:hypothetical protein
VEPAAVGLAGAVVPPQPAAVNASSSVQGIRERLKRVLLTDWVWAQIVWAGC